MPSRRTFLLRVVSATLIAVPGLAAAQAARVAETDPAAVALGYKHDATKVDAKKFPSFAAGRLCENCNLYAGKPGDAWAPCAALGNKQVAAKGWCAAWVKKA